MRRIERRSFTARRSKRSKKFNQLYRMGYNLGYDNAHDYGYQNGWEAGVVSYSQPFGGTSIIIVTTNDQRVHLQNCIDSIYAYTPEPFEIIIIDNASTDDTAAYLKSLKGKVRYRVFKSNLGFAGGTNQGLRLARGDTLLFLNNDTIVTKNWLTNMLTCLHSSEKIGLVGPVTNYISGEQLIETHYTSTEEMHRFAKAFNKSDPGKWVPAGRLTGFCVLMRRNVFERLSYLDEGFEIGNCEDDDFGFRARMMGLELVVAKDTFIHHVGSVSIKALGDQFEKVYSKNLDFYSRKWGDSHSLLHEVQQKLGGSTASMNDFYPSHTIVRGVLPQLYWVENGIRHPIEGGMSLLASRISQVDLRSWRIGPPISSQAVEEKLAHLAQVVKTEGPFPDGLLVRTSENIVYQVKGDKLHRFINDWAMLFWHLKERHQVTIDGQSLEQYAQGMPIIAPASIVANNV
ncbi:glycosyltransferase [Paenibacillus aceris]|uniref:GT2 family glycosyltransferase n=1 Tax=Paenibacillus aceris TaxID=869555 RepID=A0ABS4I7V8_9BACL|nr:GT2 family glycosyltransferase [Paenibacillus aceris]NHW39356.1 glycosyltransferase family 2 protein [Paenibacillus aceris]